MEAIAEMMGCPECLGLGYYEFSDNFTHTNYPVTCYLCKGSGRMTRAEYEQFVADHQPQPATPAHEDEGEDC